MSPKAKQSRRGPTQHLCKICNLWIADNRPQRDQHEAGAKHIANRQRLLREIAERNEKQRAQERREGKRTSGHNESRAIQQMMEIAMQATQGEIKLVENVEGEKQEAVIPGQEVDENGYPLSAESVFHWTEVTEEDVRASQDGEGDGEAHTEGFEFEEEQGEQVIAKLVSKKWESGVKRVRESEEVNASPTEDAEERFTALATFTKRKAPAGRKKRRKK
ncbi:unnamed protein product [Agarophyton chilense]